MKRTIFQIKSFSLSVPLTLDSFISSNKLCKAKLFRDGFVLIFGENRNELPRSVVFVSSEKETSPQPPRRFPSGLCFECREEESKALKNPVSKLFFLRFSASCFCGGEIGKFIIEKRGETAKTKKIVFSFS